MDNVLDLISTAAFVVVVGLAATGLLTVDLIRRELAGPRPVAMHYRALGVVMTIGFLALVILRFAHRGA